MPLIKYSVEAGCERYLGGTKDAESCVFNDFPCSLRSVTKGSAFSGKQLTEYLNISCRVFLVRCK